MNLYLSSFRLGAHPEYMTAMSGPNKHCAVIANSIDFANTTDRRRGVEREIDDLTSLGFDPDELDLREYFGKPAELAKKLGGYGLVWARGGNSFLLRKAMQQSGFDEAIHARLADDSFVYAGYSAGVVVLAPSLRGIEIVDPVDQQAEGYDPQPIWSGLGILDYYVAPHFESDHPESEAIGRMVEYFKAQQFTYEVLHDGQAIVVQGDWRMVV